MATTILGAPTPGAGRAACLAFLHRAGPCDLPERDLVGGLPFGSPFVPALR